MNTSIIGKALVRLRVTRGPSNRLSVLSTDVDGAVINTVYQLPIEPVAKVRLLTQMRNDVGAALEQAQAEVVEDNLKELSPTRIVVSGSIEGAAAALSPEHKALVHDAAIAVEEIGEDELERAINPPPATFPREPSVKLARCRHEIPHIDPTFCSAYSGPAEPSQLAEANAIREPQDFRHTDIELPAGVEAGDLLTVGGWQYEVTTEGSLEALDNRDPRLIEVPTEPVGPQPDPESIYARRRAEGEAIRRDLERENAFFTRTQGWDPRGDGPGEGDV